MVAFGTYVGLAYEVAEEKGFADQLRGPGTQQENQRLMSELADAYNANNHVEATEDQARAFLRQNLMPP